MKSSEQGMAGRLARFEANINKGLNHRLSLTLASNQPGEVDMAGIAGMGGMESMPMGPVRQRKRRRKRGMGVSLPKVSKPRIRKR